MTALTRPARQDASPRPVPWRRMAWVTWRQHRVALAGVAALLGSLALYLWLAGLQIHHAFAATAACRSASSPNCGALMGRYTTDAIAAMLLMQVVPALIGAFFGAPVLAREMETGTFRYAWTQGFGRWRWTLAKLVPLAIVAAAATGALSLLFSWFYQPFFAIGYEIPLGSLVFGLRGVAFAAWTLAAFAIGALAGMLIRRVVPAIAATLAVYGGLVLATGLWLRQHYLTPLVTGDPNLPGSAWIISGWWAKGGKFAFADFKRVPQPPGNVLHQFCPSDAAAAGNGTVSPGTLAQCLTQHGYTQWTSYQPGSRFWPFQWIEGGWLLALSVLLIAVTIWLVRRRAA